MQYENIKRRQHSVYCLTYHVVVVTKYRRKVLTPEMLEFAKEQASRLLKGCGGALLEFNGEEDNVHILMELMPNQAPSAYVGSLKSNLALLLKKNFGEQINSKLHGHGN